MKRNDQITTAANSTTMNAVEKQSLFAGAEESGVSGFNAENELTQPAPKKGIRKPKHLLKKNIARSR